MENKPLTLKELKSFIGEDVWMIMKFWRKKKINKIYRR